MKRKYDLKNKRSIIIIIIISIVIISIFSFFIYKYIKVSKVDYLVSSNSLLFDINKTPVVVNDNAKLKIKWNNNYYLIYKEKEIVLGKQAVVYNELNNNLKLYGTFYEVKGKDSVVINNNETELKNLTSSKFYKLEDRKYLIVGKSITSTDNILNTSNYLLVELDKQGNAKLINNMVNLKTLSKTIITTDSFSFDIANEVLIYGDEKIDLKKIIGTTNEYKEEPKKDSNTQDEPSKDNGNNSTNTGNTNQGTVITPDTSGEVINNNEEETPDKEEITKSTITSVLGINPSLTSIAVNYVIYDPYNNYLSTYVEVRDNNAKLVNKITLKENNTNLIIDNLNYNSVYTLLFKYTYLDESGKEQVHTFYQSPEINTKSPKFTLGLNKVSLINKTLSYKVFFDTNSLKEMVTKEENINFKIKLSIGTYTEFKTLSKTISPTKMPSYINGNFSLPTLTSGDIVSIELTEFTFKGQTIPCHNIYYKYKNS